jgi:mono/diheme cytochrome c family protein
MTDALVAGLAVTALAFGAVALGVGIRGGSDDPVAIATRAEDDSGRAIFTRMGCGSCHALAAAGSKGEIGPDLDDRLEHHTRATLIAQITSPAGGGGFSAMPDDFGSRMTERELDALVSFLLSARPER